MPRFSSRHVVAVLVLAFATLKGASPWGALSAQEEAPTVAMLKRITEAVEGFNHAGRVWVVLDSSRRVTGIFTTRDSASAALRAMRFGIIHGPVLARLLDVPVVPKGCVHYQSAMHPICPNTLSPILFRDIDTIRVTFELRNGESRTIALPKGADAIFFSISALDKFVYPYYARVYGAAEANAMRERTLRESRPPQ